MNENKHNDDNQQDRQFARRMRAYGKVLSETSFLLGLLGLMLTSTLAFYWEWLAAAPAVVMMIWFLAPNPFSLIADEYERGN